MSLQALVYDGSDCSSAPVVAIEESAQGLEATGNGHLLYVPAAMLPQCAQLYVNQQEVPYHVTLTAPPQPVAEQVPYLQLSAYLQEQCGDAPDGQFSLLADGTVHPIGEFAPQTIQNMRQTLNPDMVQTQQFNEDQTPVMLYYKATTTGLVTIYNSIQGDEASEVMTVPLQQYMDTCFTQENPFPGFQGAGKSGRGEGHHQMAVLQELLGSIGSTPVAQQAMKLTKDAIAEDQVDHVATLFSGFNHRVRARSQGLPVSFQLTSSTGPQPLVDQLEDPLQLADGDKVPHRRPKHGHHGPKHHDRFGLNKYLTPCEQSAALMIFGLIAALIVVKMLICRRRAAALAASNAPAMQERPVEKRNKDYVAVPTQSV